ncbi:hypothetical protein ASB57_18525 [Bordetella sp. N]|nr:hypothetical protein ASB57_18525 [Bordetella sp. N]
MVIALSTLLLAACQSVPQGLTPAQVAVLKEEGFSQTDEGWEFGISDKVLFDTDQAVVKPASVDNIKRLASRLLDVGLNRMRLDGHTDNRGSDAHNQQLSERRAQAVADIVIAAGMPAANVLVRGQGAGHPVADNGSAAGRAENRRVAVVIVTP